MILALPMLAGCNHRTGVTVESGTIAEVDARQIGIPEYPGAHRNAIKGKTSIDLPFASVRVYALKYSTSDASDQVLAYYRSALAKYGKVEEKAGSSNVIHMGEFGWNSSANQRTLQVSSGDEQRLIFVKLTDEGSQFALVLVKTGEERKPI